MSEKVRDNRGRWRSKTIAFRISPEENSQLEEFVRLSGLTKQDYIIRRVLKKDVIVYGNPRVHKALKQKMEALCECISGVPDTAAITPETAEILRFIAEIYSAMKIEGMTKSGKND